MNDRIAYALNWDSLHDDMVRDNIAALTSHSAHVCMYVCMYVCMFVLLPHPCDIRMSLYLYALAYVPYTTDR